MAIDVFVQVVDGRLVTVDQIDDERVGKLKNGGTYRAKLTSAQERSVKQNNFYWAVINEVVHQHPFYTKKEQFHIWLKVRLGYVTKMEFHDTEAAGIAQKALNLLVSILPTSAPHRDNLYEANKAVQALQDAGYLRPETREVISVDSTSFPAMEPDEFKHFMDQVFDVICMEVLPGTDRDALLSASQGRKA